jgi:hypothetical protein
MWLRFWIELGDGVQQIVENKRRAKARRKEARRQKWRKFFGMKPSEPKVPLEDDQEVTGKVIVVRMQRRPCMGRKIFWELDGVPYRWSGTRQFSKSPVGLSHNLKVPVAYP